MSTPTIDGAWSDGPVREKPLTAAQLNVSTAEAIAGHASNDPTEQGLASDDATLVRIVELLRVYGGVILAGPPGTSKSWYAAQVAHALSDGDEYRRAFVQLHPSYQYEDFMQGLTPRTDGVGFIRTDGLFVRMCRRAAANPTVVFVLVVDELSRGEPARVFGEALTYLEQSKRDLPFAMASGETMLVPRNLLIVATMNPSDRGVDEVDAAFERRFARIAMDPDADILDSMLSGNDMDVDLQGRLVSFFKMVNGRSSYNPSMAVGHTYFSKASTREDLRRLWEHQLRFLFERAFRLDREGLKELQERWAAVLGPSDTGADTPPPNTDEA